MRYIPNRLNLITSMFIFGKNTFRIKSYTPFELGLSKNPNQGFTIEIRQNYFHLLGLPCFDMGITWHIRKGPTLSLMPEPYRQQIDTSKLRVSTPWRTFTLPILIMVCLVAYNANMVREKRQNTQQTTENEAKNKKKLENQKPFISDNSSYEVEKVKMDSLNN
ncbi:MAG: hypothetical protein U5L45_05050 [Saprospiraceae bacterium]|nr:hypothetical protein [Saprospiraceae bacterium]